MFRDLEMFYGFFQTLHKSIRIQVAIHFRQNNEKSVFTVEPRNSGNFGHLIFKRF